MEPLIITVIHLTTSDNAKNHIHAQNCTKKIIVKKEYNFKRQAIVSLSKVYLGEKYEVGTLAEMRLIIGTKAKYIQSTPVPIMKLIANYSITILSAHSF